MALTKVRSSMILPVISADAYATVQDAINAVPVGGVLEFSAGTTYVIPSRLTITTAMTITAYGATLQFPSGRSAGGFSNDAVTITSSNVNIYGGTWKEVAPDGTYPQIGGYGIVFLGTENGTGVAPTYLENVSIQDAMIQNWQHTSILFSMCKDFRFESNTIDNIGSTGLQTRSSNNGIINDNIIKNIHADGVLGSLDNAYGIGMTLSNSGNTVARPVSHTITVSGNFISNVPTWEGIDTHGGYAITVTGNTVINTYTGIAMVAYIGGATSADDVGCSHCTVTGNTVYNNLSVVPRASAARGIVIDGQVRSGGTLGQQVTVSGNTVTNHGGQSATDDLGAIEVLTVNNAMVSGNSIYNSGSAGISMSSCQNMNVNSNNIYQINPNNTVTFPSGVFTFSGNPTATDTITLNGVTCTFIAGASVVNSLTAIDVLIGASLADTITNLKAIVESARDTGTATVMPNGALGFCNYTATGTTLSISYQFPTRMLAAAWTLAESSSVISVSGSSLSIPTNDQGAGIVIDILSGGATPTGFVSGNNVRNPDATAIRGICQKVDTSVSYSNNVFTGKGILYDLVGSSVWTTERVDSFYEGNIDLDLPNIAQNTFLYVNVPYPSNAGNEVTVDLSSERYLQGLVVTAQPSRGYIILQIANYTNGAVNIAQGLIYYKVSKIDSASYGDPTT